MEFCHLELELSGCNKEVAALHSDHYTQVLLYSIALKQQHKTSLRDVQLKYSHSSFLWCSSNFARRNELLPRPHPQDGTIVAVATVTQLEVGELSPGKGQLKEGTLFKEVCGGERGGEDVSMMCVL